MQAEDSGFTWNGKSNAQKEAETDIVDKRLIYVPEESKNADVTKNIYIEGDNLEALKLLKKEYKSKIKMIYIDPPYNTGNDFVFNDKFASHSKASKKGIDHHSNWLNMIYPRISAAHQLLSEDGLIFISIDDNELDNLKRVCNEIFGEENFIGCFVIITTPNARDYGHIGKMHEYALFYAKNYDAATTNMLTDEKKRFKYKDTAGGYNIHPLYNSNVAFTDKNRPNLYYPFYIDPNSATSENFYTISLDKKQGWIEIYPPLSSKDKVQFVWRWSKQRALKYLNTEICGYKTNTGEYRIIQKMRQTKKIIRSIISGKQYTSRRGTSELKNIFGKKVFSFPKPLALITDFILAATDSNSIVLDFFSGSATTAHAVMHVNAMFGGNRRFIMVQIPQECSRDSEAYGIGLKTICDIGKERIRLSGELVKENFPECNDIDTGFKVYKIN